MTNIHVLETTKEKIPENKRGVLIHDIIGRWIKNTNQLKFREARKLLNEL